MNILSVSVLFFLFSISKGNVPSFQPLEPENKTAEIIDLIKSGIALMQETFKTKSIDPLALPDFKKIYGPLEPENKTAEIIDLIKSGIALMQETFKTKSIDPLALPDFKKIYGSGPSQTSISITNGTMEGLSFLKEEGDVEIKNIDHEVEELRAAFTIKSFTIQFYYNIDNVQRGIGFEGNVTAQIEKSSAHIRGVFNSSDAFLRISKIVLDSDGVVTVKFSNKLAELLVIFITKLFQIDIYQLVVVKINQILEEQNQWINEKIEQLQRKNLVINF